MIDGILYWLIDRLIDFLSRINPARVKKAEAVKAEADRLDALAKENEELAKKSEAAYLESHAKRIEWDRLLELSQAEEKDAEARFNASQERIKALEAEAAKRKADIDSKSDHDVLRGDL